MATYHREALPFITRAGSGSDVQKLGSLLCTAASHATVSPLEKSIRFDIRHLRIEKFAVTRMDLHGDMECRFNDNREQLLVFFPISGKAHFRIRDQDIASSPQTVVITPAKWLTEMRVEGSRHQIVVETSLPDLRGKLSTALARPLHESLKFQLTLPSDSSPGKAIASIVELLAHGLLDTESLHQSPLTIASLTEGFQSLLLEQVWHNYSDAMDRNVQLALPKHVEAAISFMQNHLAQPLTIEDIAAAVNVSSRTLQQSFKQFKNVTPMAYLKELRMQAVHRELEWAQPGISVGEITRRWGFTHLGRFAAEYRERFGKAPSGTLKGL